MVPFKAIFRQALLLLPLIQLAAAVPAKLQERETPCIALGTCPGENSPPAPATTPPPTTFGCLHEADPDGAQGFCPSVAASGWCVCSDSSTYAIETGANPCGYTSPPAAGPTSLPTTNCDGAGAGLTSTSAPAPSATSSGRTKCNPSQCPKYCSVFGGQSTNPGDIPSKKRRSIIGIPHNEVGLDRRFYENSNADQFPYELLKKNYITNICPSGGKNTYIWRGLSTQRQDYAAALQGLSGCTTIFVASKNGVFSSHVWEQDEANTPKRDLSPGAYKDTLADLTAALSPHKDDLSGGEAFLIIPTDPDSNATPDNPENYLYGVDIVNAILQAIQDAAGIEATVKKYDPLDFETSTELGTNRRGTFSFQFDPKYNNNGETTRAYRIIGEGTVYSEKTGL
ncbi:hypothetical protein MMC22_007845 [Lobaria immixta]|nr:hypothetical protein [Lobaria immixta]